METATLSRDEKTIIPQRTPRSLPTLSGFEFLLIKNFSVDAAGLRKKQLHCYYSISERTGRSNLVGKLD